jgi:transposase InsO family protein
VHWFNTERIHGYLNDESPYEYEAAYAAQHTDQSMVGIQ